MSPEDATLGATERIPTTQTGLLVEDLETAQQIEAAVTLAALWGARADQAQILSILLTPRYRGLDMNMSVSDIVDELDAFQGYSGSDFLSEVQTVAKVLHNYYAVNDLGPDLTFTFHVSADGEIRSIEARCAAARESASDAINAAFFLGLKDATLDQGATGLLAAVGIAEAVIAPFRGLLQ